MRAADHDYWFLSTIAILILGGLFLLSSASVAYSERLYGNIAYVTLRQIIAVLIGVTLFFVVSCIPQKFWKRLAPFCIVLAVFLLGSVFIPHIGLKIHAASRWIHIGPLTIQPSEVAKLLIVIGFAWWLDRIRDKVGTFAYGFLPFLGMIAVMGSFMALEPDIGTFLIMAGTATLMYVVAGARWLHIALFVAIAILALLLLAYFAPYRWQRIIVFLHPETEPQGIGYQVRQASIAIGSGGFWGMGYGASLEKYNVLPEPVGDSIFAIISEEFGFLGGIAAATVFLVFLWQGIRIAKHAPDLFSKMFVTGIVLTIVIQSFLNMGAISGLLPLTGVPLPFISYGGTSVVIFLTGLGIVYRIARQS